ncbi:MAG: ATP-binding response regulator [Deferrisomatales bacterium]
MSTALPMLLVVDDDPGIGPLVEAILDGDGVRLEVAPSGLAALARVDAGLEPDLVILDLMMPGMGGLEVLAALRSRPGFDQVPVILLTAHSRIEDVVAGLEAGATDYVTKPFDLGALRARVRAALRMRGVFRELARAREAALHEERLKVLVQTTGAMTHALNQPLTAALLKTEVLLGRAGGTFDEIRPDLELVHRCLMKVTRQVQRIRHLTTYRTAPYLDGLEIVDLEEE